MIATVIYDNIKDRELVELAPSKFPIFLTFIDASTLSGKKEARSIKSHWCAKKNPFVVVMNDLKVDRVFYSEDGNAILKLINWLNEG